MHQRRRRAECARARLTPDELIALVIGGTGLLRALRRHPADAWAKARAIERERRAAMADALARAINRVLLPEFVSVSVFCEATYDDNE